MKVQCQFWFGAAFVCIASFALTGLAFGALADCNATEDVEEKFTCRNKRVCETLGTCLDKQIPNQCGFGVDSYYYDLVVGDTVMVGGCVSTGLAADNCIYCKGGSYVCAVVLTWNTKFMGACYVNCGRVDGGQSNPAGVCI